MAEAAETPGSRPSPAGKPRRRGPPARKIPERTCVACRRAQPKRSLIRLVRVEDGLAEIDATGKRSGRGAYLCRFGECWETGLTRRALDHALKTQLKPENRQALANFAAQLPRTPPGRIEIV
ncbi:MAG TPA: YlxR family protein [Chloroflexota bacterium]